MVEAFLMFMLIGMVLLLVLNNRKPKDKNPINPDCDKKDCIGCKYYNNNVCDK